MIETTVRSYLSSKLNVPIFVGMKPVEKPKEYIVIEVVDSGRINMIDAITFSFMSYSDSLENASKLNNKVKEAMYNAIEVESISSSKLGGGSQNLDTQTKEYAYECIFNLFYTED